MKITGIALLLTITAVSFAETLMIDLPTALKLADEKNTDLAIQIQKVTQADLEKSAAWYQWVPTLRLGASYGSQDGALQETDGTVIDANRTSRYAGMGAGAFGAGMPVRPGLSAGIDLSEAIFSPLAAKQNYRAVQFGEESTRLRVMLEVATAYYELVRAAREVEICQISAENAEKLAKQTRDFASSGQGLLADAERAEVESLIQQQKIELALERRETSVIKLGQLLRLDERVELVPADHMISPLALVSEELPLNELVDQALTTRPEIGQSKASVAAEQARLRQEQYGIFLPKVEVGYSYGNFDGRGGSNDQDDSRNDFYGMVYWQFDSLGLRNANDIKMQRARMNEAKAYEEQALVDIVSEVRMAHAQLNGARRQLDLSRRAVDSARKSYELNSERIFENQGLPLEALQSIKALSEAEFLYLSVATKYNLAQLRLISASGKGL